VYAGRDGNVYQKTEDGWAPVDNAGAQNASRTDSRESASANRASYDSSSSQLNRDYQSRQDGFNRYSQHQSGAASRSRARPSRGRR